MVLVLVGVAILAAGVHALRRSRPLRGEPLAGRVVDVEVKRSSLTGSAQRLYAATVEYRDPVTGETRRLEPDSHQPRAVRVGDQVALVRDPASGQVRLPLPRPLAQLALPFVLGAAVIGLGLLDLAR